LNVLITGGAGYIGSHIVKELLGTNYNIVVYDNLQKGHREAVKGGVFVKGDLRDKDLLTKVIREHEINSVIHLAADSLVGESINNPAKYFTNNVSNGINLLNCMVENGIKYIVFSSTAAVYGVSDEIPITEECKPRPTNVYGETKLIFENILKRYEEAYGLKYISLRYFNAAGADAAGEIGEDHRPETHLIPILLQTVLGKREKVYIFGDNYETEDGTCIRDYVHVTDLADAHTLALQALESGQESSIYNLGNGKGFSVKKVIETVERVTGKTVNSKVAERRWGDPPVLVANAEKARKALGWQPRYFDIEDIIATAWKWHYNNQNGYDLCQQSCK